MIPQAEAQQAAQQPTEATEADLLYLIANVRDYAITILDPQGRVCSWNDAAEQIKGYKAKEVLGKHFSIFYPKEDVEAGKPARESKVAAEQGRFEDDCWRVRKDGSRFWANVVLTSLRDQSGWLKGFGKITRDLTDAEEGG